MKPTMIFPIVLIVLDVGAALMFAYYRDVRMAIYWLAAAVLTSSITF